MTIKRSCWIAGLLLALTGSDLRGAAVSWTNTGGGLWSAPANWDAHRVPNSSDSVNVTAAGTYTVKVDIDASMLNLTLGGASGQQTLTNAAQAFSSTNILVTANGIFGLGGGTLNGGPLTNQGTFYWGGGTVYLPVTVAPAATMNLDGPSVNLAGPLTNAGTINWSGGPLSVANNAGAFTGAIYNQAGGLFILQSDQGVNSQGYGFESFSNAGTIRKLAGLGQSSFNLPFTNAGTIDAQSGTIRFASGGNIGGTYNTASGAVIEFDSGSFVQSGSPNITGSGVCRQNGTILTLNSRITDLVLAGGNVALSPSFEGSGAIQNLQLEGATLIGTNTVIGTLGINGGGLASPLTVTATGILDFNGSQVTITGPITNAGTINWSGGSLSVANNAAAFTGAIYNQAGGLFNIQSDQGVNSQGYGFELFNNAGTVRKIAGLGQSSFNLPFTNTGTVDAQSGTIRFASGGTIGGTYNTASGAVIEFDSGSFAQSGSPNITGSGVCRQNGTTVTLNSQIANLLLAGGNVALSPSFQGSGAIQNLQLDGASLIGTNTVVGTLGMNGGELVTPLTVTATGVLDFNGGQVTITAPLTNAGTINWSSGPLSVANNAAAFTGAIYNQAGGLFILQSDQGINSQGYGFELFSNAGTVRKLAGLGVSSFNLPFTNTGTVDAQNGTIHFGAGGNIGGTYNTALGTFIEFDNGSFVQSGSPVITGSGLCRQNGATVTLNSQIANLVLAGGNVALSPSFQGSGAIQNLQLEGASLLGTNTVVGTLGMNGGGVATPLTVTATGILDFNGGQVTITAPLTNAGTINMSGGPLSVANNAAAYTGAIYNQAGGLFVLQSDQGINSQGYGFELFNNAGTVRKTAGLGTTSFTLPFVNTGTLDAQSGTIRIAGPYTQTGGTMNFGISSLSYFGQIAFAASAPLTGTLSVNFNGSYFPSAGDSFPLVSYTSRAGVFTSLSLPSQAQWETNYSASIFTLSILSVAGGGLPVTLTPLSLAAGNFTLRINGSVGPSYILQASTNLTDWTAISTNKPSVMPLTVVDTKAGSFNQRFYRALLGP